jgi:hypothetical protein
LRQDVAESGPWDVEAIAAFAVSGSLGKDGFAGGHGEGGVVAENQRRIDRRYFGNRRKTPFETVSKVPAVC